MWQPDRLQLAIMRELAGSPGPWGARSSFKGIAEKLGVDEETVRNRLRRMQEYGMLRGWRAMVNPELLGRQASVLYLEFDDEEAKDGAVEKLRSLDGVVLVDNFYGKSLRVGVYHRGEEGLSESTRAIEAATGGKTTLNWRMSLPESELRMTKTDWEIVKSLLRDADKEPSEIADEMNISLRTAKRRIDKLHSSYALLVQPVLDLRKARGAPCTIFVRCSIENKRSIDKTIISKFERIVFKYTDSDRFSLFTIPSENVAQCREISKWIREQDGVELVKSDIYQEMIPVSDWLESEVTRQISTLQVGLTRPAGDLSDLR